MKSFGGATVTGTVTAGTELRCRSAGDLETEAEAGDDHGARAASDDGPGDDHGDRSGRGGQDDPSGGDQGDDQGDDDGADGAGDDASGPDACPAGALAAGATVHEASLAVTSTGAEWREVALVAPKAACRPTVASGVRPCPAPGAAAPGRRVGRRRAAGPGRVRRGAARASRR